MKKALAIILPLLLTYPFSILALELYQAKEGVTARKWASEDSPVIYHFKAGEEFKVDGKEGEWLKVRFSTKEYGFVKQIEVFPTSKEHNSPAIDQPQGITLRGEMLKWGASQADAKAILLPQRSLDFYCSSEHAELPGVVFCFTQPIVDFGDKTYYSASLMFLNDKFYEYSVSFPTSRFIFIANTIEQRLGKPTKSEASEVQNRMGAKFEQMEKSWAFSETAVHIRLRASDITNGSLSITYLPIGREVKTGSGKAPF